MCVVIWETLQCRLDGTVFTYLRYTENDDLICGGRLCHGSTTITKYLDQCIETALWIVNVARDGSVPHSLLKEGGVGFEFHLVLKAVGRRARLLLAVLVLHQADVGHDLLVDKTAEPDPVIARYLLNGTAYLPTQSHLTQ